MKIVLWRGFHSAALLEILSEALESKLLCILCPPHLKNYDFLDFLPKGEVTLVGEWNQEERTQAEDKITTRTFAEMPEVPNFGVFTSGTLSFNPSLILFRKQEVEHSLQSILDLFKAETAEKIICYPQPFHIFGLTLGYIHSLLWKKPLKTPDGRYQKSFHDVWLSSDRKGLLTLGAPVHFFDLLQRTTDSLESSDSSSICGGARVSPELWNKFQTQLGIKYPSIGYGATEACPGLSHLPPGMPPQESGDIGYWLKGVETFEHPSGFEFSGPNKCFARISENSSGKFELDFPKKVLIKDDLLIKDGRIIYQGRCDLKMNRGGEKFSLELIEEKIQESLGMPVLATALSDSRLGEKLGLCVQSISNVPDIKKRCKEIVEKNFQWILQDHEIQVLENFPINANGKWDRKKATRSLKE
ncbi:MAG: class I adenylate-forming enzyme family protein [Bdellovibrionota bacterium]